MRRTADTACHNAETGATRGGAGQLPTCRSLSLPLLPTTLNSSRPSLPLLQPRRTLPTPLLLAYLHWARLLLFHSRRLLSAQQLLLPMPLLLLLLPLPLLLLLLPLLLLLLLLPLLLPLLLLPLLLLLLLPPLLLLLLLPPLLLLLLLPPSPLPLQLLPLLLLLLLLPLLPLPLLALLLPLPPTPLLPMRLLPPLRPLLGDIDFHRDPTGRPSWRGTAPRAVNFHGLQALGGTSTAPGNSRRCHAMQPVQCWHPPGCCLPHASAPSRLVLLCCSICLFPRSR